MTPSVSAAPIRQLSRAPFGAPTNGLRDAKPGYVGRVGLEPTTEGL